MPQMKNYVNYFTKMALGVEKKITQLLNYVRPLSPTAVGEIQEQMLMDLTRQLQESIDHLQLTWLEKRDQIQPPNFDRVSTFVRSTIATGEAALRKAKRFVVLGSRPKLLVHPPTEPPTNEPDCLDNTFKPEGCLKRTMSLEEAQYWLRKFDQWFVWNAKVLIKKGLVAQRMFLENFLDERMLSKVQSDVLVNPSTPIQGPNGLLKKLELYYTDKL